MKKLMKIIVSIIMMIIMLVPTLPTSVSAATQNPYEQYVKETEFTVSTSFCASKSKTKVYVDIAADSEMSAGLFKLKFDTNIFQAISVDIGAVLKNGHTSKNILKDGYVMISYAHVNPTYDAGRIFEVELEAIGDVPEGEAYLDVPVELEVLDLRNYEDYHINT